LINSQMSHYLWGDYEGQISFDQLGNGFQEKGIWGPRHS
jgi:hypothetical protein